MAPLVVDLTGDSASDGDEAAALQPERTEAKRTAKKGKKASRLKAIGDYIRQRAAHGPTGSQPLQVAQLARSRRTAGDTALLALCNGGTRLFNTTLIDRGWACGYRNCQMLISSLATSAATSQAAASRIPTGRVPSVGELQQMLELAWREGYDPEGAAQLGHRILGTHKWIGATEVYCIMAHLGFRAQIVDFHCPTAADGTHPALISWIVDYFTGSSAGSSSSSDSAAPDGGAGTRFVSKHPLYLQHQGHSRTIVGVEMSEAATCLLVFDPDKSHRPSTHGGVQLSELRLLLGDTRRAPQYQVLYVDDSPLGPAPKRIVSVRVP